MSNLAERILELALQQGLTLTAAESCTGGMVCAAITDIPGSSAIFQRGFVTYSNAAKSEMLGVDPQTLRSHGAVSEEVAQQMAVGAKRAATADIAVAISGIAGPGGSKTKPEGRVCYAIATRDGVQSETCDHGALGRDKVRTTARDHALTLILRVLEQVKG